jgi:protein-disulfide isomerase
MVISEFADFLCGHCKFAAPPLHAFVKGRSDVRLEFYSFALDGECNSVIDQAVGTPCFLAKANYCSNKIQLGWTLHDLFFSRQSTFQESRTADGAQERLKKLWTHDESKWNELVSCIEDPKTIENVKLQAKLGENSGVKGTPTIYVNGKKLPRGQLLPVLEKVYSEL